MSTAGELPRYAALSNVVDLLNRRDWMLETVVVPLLTAFASGAAVYLTPRIIDWWRFSHQKQLLGTWKSQWEIRDLSKDNWTTETVRVELKLGKLRIESIDNPDGYEWSATAKLIEKRHLIGKWKSKRKGAMSEGVFMLSISPHGRITHGYYAGPNLMGRNRSAAWVIGRNESDLVQVRELLNLNKPHSAEGAA